MYVVTAEEMNALDRRAIEEYGIPAAALMERAGVAVAAGVARVLGVEQDRISARVHIVCGKGSNAADGMVAARTLANRGARVRLFLVEERERLSQAAATFLRAVEKMGIPIHQLGDGNFKKLPLTLRTADVIVDAMLGTGTKGPLRPRYARTVKAINTAQRPVVAVDVPTGVDADSGAVGADAVRATLTVTFGLPKVGHLLAPGKHFTGRLDVAEIGFPRPLLENPFQDGERAKEADPAENTDARVVRTWVCGPQAHRMLRARPGDAHKWNFGRVVVAAGSLGMAGAAILALKGALRSGTGLAVWAGPRELLTIVQQAVPEATAIPLPGEEGTWTAQSAEALLSHLGKGDVLALGPGMGRGEGASATVLRLLQEAKVPTVVDADALNAMASFGPPVRELLPLDVPRVLTPHVKEAARLLGWEAHEVASRRLEAVEEIAKMWRATVVLKGNPTLVYDPVGRLGINGSGDVSLATGGTGDVLTGVCAALLASGHTAWEAAAVGVFVHGRGGELAGARNSSYSTTASDVVEALPQAFQDVRDAAEVVDAQESRDTDAGGIGA